MKLQTNLCEFTSIKLLYPFYFCYSSFVEGQNVNRRTINESSSNWLYSCRYCSCKKYFKNHPEAEVTVYERNDNISFLSCGIALYVGGVVKDPAGLFYSNPEELSSLGATVKMEHDVTDVDTENKTVTAKDLKTGETETVSYDKLVMTTGSWPIIPPISGIDAKNVLLCKNYNQANEIIAQAKEAKRVVIVGGGYIGIELVEAFVESGKQVTLIDGLDRILNKYLDKPFTDILEKELTDRGVTLALGENVTEFITDEEGKVKQVATPTDTFDTDMVILCVGFRPNTKLIRRKSRYTAKQGNQSE